MNSDSITKVAFVGAGYMADEHAKAFTGLDGVELVGVTSRTRSRAESLAEARTIPHVFDDIDSLYEKTQADILVVAVDEGALRPVLEQAAKHPWLILTEKPLGVDLEDGEKIVEMMNGMPAKLYMALNRRFMASTRACQEDLAAQDTLRFIHVQDQQSFEEARASGKPETVVRNYMYANSIHLVDYLMAFGRGTVESVEVLSPWHADNPGVVVAGVKFSSGDIGLYNAIWNGPGPWAITVSTPQRRWEMRPLEQAQTQNAGERKLNVIDVGDIDSNYKPGLRLMAQHAVKASKGEKHDLTPMDEALRTMRLISAIYGHCLYEEIVQENSQ